MEEIALDVSGTGEQVARVVQAEVADDGTIVALARLRSDPTYPEDRATALRHAAKRRPTL